MLKMSFPIRRLRTLPKAQRKYFALESVANVGPRNKYGAIPTIVHGIRFDSTKESRRYLELRLLERARVIRDLEMQPRYPIDVVALATRRGELVNCGQFTADFRYVEVATGAVVVEDTKSGPTKTTAYRLRKRLVEAIHGVTIREV